MNNFGINSENVLNSAMLNSANNAEAEKSSHRSSNLENFEAEKMAHEYDGSEEVPAVYVGTYGKYSEGSIFGMWVDLSSFADYDEFEQFCRDLHADEADPEIMFQDYENFPRAWYCESFMDEDTFDRIAEYASKSEEEREMWEDYISLHDDEASFEEAREHCHGRYDDEEDFARYLFEECYASELPEIAQRYFDFEAFARDLFAEGYTFSDNGFVFCD